MRRIARRSVALRDSWKFGLLQLLLYSAVLVLPVGVFAECRVIEYADHNEVDCEDATVPKPGQPLRKEPLKLETTSQKEFMFYSPVKAGSKITLSGDLSPSAIASPGDLLLSYRIDELRDKIYTTSSVSIVYVERTGDATFTIREEGSGARADGPNVTGVTFNDKKNHLLLIPFSSGCSSATGDAVFLKMNRLEGNQLYYRIVLPPCLSGPLEQSIPD